MVSSVQDELYLKLNQSTQGLSFPAAILDKVAYFQNIAYFLKNCSDKQIRIATKSLRIPKLIQHLVADYSQVKGVMSYHANEALYLASLGIQDILMGYPLMDKRLIQKIGEVNQGHTKISLMVDCQDHLEVIEDVGKKLSTSFPICIDIDLSMDVGPVHFGVWRSPVRNEANLLDLIRVIKSYKHVHLVGVMGYEAQIAGVPDTSREYGLKNVLIKRLKKSSIRKLRSWRRKAIDLIRESGFDLQIINGGGTGSTMSTRDEAGINEITVGSGFYGSHFFDNFKDIEVHPALFYAIQITRHPGDHRYTAHGGGYVASGQIERLKQPKIYLPVGAKLIAQEGSGEVQTPFIYKGDVTLQLGHPIFLRHAKAGELLEHFNEVHVYENDEITDSLKTYRGLGLSFG